MASKANQMLAENKNPDEAMSLFKQSHIECDRQVFLNTDRIWKAFDKCTPNNADAMLIKAHLHLQQNDMPKAVKFGEKCVRSFPRDAHFRKYLAFLYWHSSQMEKSLREINKAIELDPTQTRWLYEKACVMPKVTLAEQDEAIECFRKYLELNPVDERNVSAALFCLTQMYEQRGDVENACLYWERAVEDSRQHREWLDVFEGPEFVRAREDCRKEISEDFRRLMIMCGACEKLRPKFKCFGCMAEAYCDRQCQLAKWKVHKSVCKK